MAFSDCSKCWDTPCSCGYDYKDWSRERRIAYAAVILGVDEAELDGFLGEFIPKNHPMHGEK